MSKDDESKLQPFTSVEAYFEYMREACKHNKRLAEKERQVIEKSMAHLGKKTALPTLDRFGDPFNLSFQEQSLKVIEEFKDVQQALAAAIELSEIKGQSIAKAEKIIEALALHLGEEYAPSLTGHAEKLRGLMLRVFGRKPEVSAVDRVLVLKAIKAPPTEKTIRNLINQCFPEK